MLQRDFLMKMLQDLFDAIAKIINNNEKNLTEKQRDIIALYTIFNHDANFFRSSDINSILLIMSELDDFFVQIEMLAEIFYVDAKFFTRSANIKNELLQKSLYLYIYIDDRCEEFSIHRQERIEELKSLIK